MSQKTRGFGPGTLSQRCPSNLQDVAYNKGTILGSRLMQRQEGFLSSLKGNRNPS
jgi:hypothetical protein